MIFSETVRPTILGVRSEILVALLYLRVVCISHCCTAGQNGVFEGPLGLGTENGDGCVLSYQILWSTSQDIFSQNSHCHIANYVIMYTGFYLKGETEYVPPPSPQSRVLQAKAGLYT